MNPPADPLSRATLLGLVATLQADAEVERGSLARLLHHELGGVLTAARLALSALHGTANEAEAPALAAALAAIEAQILEALEVKRRLVERLHPGLLDHFGVGVALEALYQAACRGAGIALEVKAAATTPPVEGAIALYRLGEAVLEDLLARAPRRVSLSVEVVGAQCRLRVVHDAPPPGFAATPSYTALRLRLRRLHGGLSVRHTRDGFEQVTARLPLPAPAA